MSSCCRFGLMLQVRFLSLQVHRPVVAGSPNCCRFKIIVACSFLDSSTMVWGSQTGCDAMGSIFYEFPRCCRFISLQVKANQRGLVASYREPFDSVVLRINDQLEMSILSYESGMMKPPIYCIKFIVTRQFILFYFCYFHNRGTCYKWWNANTKDKNAHIFVWNLYLNYVWSWLCI